MSIRIAALAAALALPLCAGAADQELNLYTSRHYQTDEALYTNFTKATGIKVNRIEGKEDALIERIKSEGANSPADILVTVDAGRLWGAEQAGIFAPVKSAALDKLIPAHLRHPDGLWFGFSTRARVIVYDKAKIKPGEVASYEDLANPKWKGKVCIRSSSNIYNLSLMGAMVERLGEKKAEEWARGVVANFARDPKGGDTDQIKAIAAGECALGLANTYYYVRLAESDKPAEKAVADKVGVVFPNQSGPGAHINVSGAGLLKHAPHKEAAIKFLEYLASPEAQKYFAEGNNEFPVVAGTRLDAKLAALGDFKADSLNVSVLGRNQPVAQKVYDRAGWK